MPGTIYDFDDYRAYLGEWLDAKKSRSIRGLATKLGCSSSYVAMVRKGSRNLNLEHARHWAWGLHLDTYESDYFEALVRSEHGQTEAMRSLARRQIVAARAWDTAQQQERVVQLHSHWYGPAIAELAKTAGFLADAEWIAKQLVPNIEVEQAQATLDALFELEILVELADGSIEARVPSSTLGANVGDDVMAQALTKQHRDWMEVAPTTLAMPSEIRFLSNVIFAVDTQRINEVVDVLMRLHIEAAEAASGHEPTHVYQLGVVLMPRSGGAESE